MGSNPISSLRFAGEVAEWSKARDWKSRIPLKGIVGSNPTLSVGQHSGDLALRCESVRVGRQQRYVLRWASHLNAVFFLFCVGELFRLTPKDSFQDMNPVWTQQNVLNPYGVLFWWNSVNPPGGTNMKALWAFNNALSADFAYTLNGYLRHA